MNAFEKRLDRVEQRITGDDGGPVIIVTVAAWAVAMMTPPSPEDLVRPYEGRGPVWLSPTRYALDVVGGSRARRVAAVEEEREKARGDRA